MTVTAAGARHFPAGLAVVGGLALAVVAAMVLRGRPPAPVPSTLSSAPGGMRALYLVLAREGVPVGRWTRPGWPERGTLVAAVGALPPPPAAVSSLERWVRGGGRAVLLGTAPTLSGAFGMTELPVPFGGGGRAEPAVALPEVRGAQGIATPGAAALLPLSRTVQAVPLYVSLGLWPVAVEIPFGRGRLVWIASAAAWSNAVLARDPANLRLAFNLLPGHGRVWFDEAVFGADLALRQAAPPAPARHGPPALPLPRAAGPALLALALAGATGAWAAGWRRFPVRGSDPAPPPPDDALEVLAALLWRARRPPRRPGHAVRVRQEPGGTRRR